MDLAALCGNSLDGPGPEQHRPRSMTNRARHNSRGMRRPGAITVGRCAVSP